MPQAIIADRRAAFTVTTGVGRRWLTLQESVHLDVRWQAGFGLQSKKRCFVKKAGECRYTMPRLNYQINLVCLAGQVSIKLTSLFEKPVLELSENY